MTTSHYSALSVFHIISAHMLNAFARRIAIEFIGRDPDFEYNTTH
jgi:hypothetical protein